MYCVCVLCVCVCVCECVCDNTVKLCTSRAMVASRQLSHQVELFMHMYPSCGRFQDSCGVMHVVYLTSIQDAMDATAAATCEEVTYIQGCGGLNQNAKWLKSLI